MGEYVSRQISDSEYYDIIDCIRNGYLDHKPNEQIATILVLEANLGCRIGDIVALRTDSFINDGGIWKIRITEQKTKKTRCFIVPKPVKDFIDQWIEKRHISDKEGLFTIKCAAVWKALRQVREFLDLENVSTHSFRKSCANRLYEQSGHDIEAVRAFLNHSDTKITMKYIQRTDAQLEDAISKAVSII